MVRYVVFTGDRYVVCNLMDVLIVGNRSDVVGISVVEDNFDRFTEL